MTQIRSLIIDDNFHSREEVKYLLKPHRCVEVVGEADNGISGLELTQQLAPDIVFLDIEMPHLTGLEYAEIIRTDYDSPPGIIFIAASKDHAVNVFVFQPIHYLVKPIDEKQLSRAINWAKKLIERQPSRVETSRLEIKGLDAATTYLAYDEIICIACSGGMTKVHTANAIYETKTSVSDFFDRLERHNFQKARRACIVNRSYPGVFRVISSGDGSGVLVIAGYDEKIEITKNFYKYWIKD